jgi:DNA invertase Pin-like site-specific DNA recombinase
MNNDTTDDRAWPRATLPLVRCAVYTRKSTEEGLEQEFNSLDAQREAAEAYVRSQAGQGWSLLPQRYDDGGFTGGNMDRPALQRLLADIRAGQVDCCVVYKVDRLSRSLLDFARLMETFEKHKVAFASITQQFNSATSMGRLVLNVLLSFAQFEREIIAERTRDKVAPPAARASGPAGGRCWASTLTRAAASCWSTPTRPSASATPSPSTWSTGRCCRWCRSWSAAAGSTNAGRRGRGSSAAAGRSPRPACTGC